MRRALVLMWLGLVLPFGLTMINGGPDGWLPHVLFHPTYIGFLAVGVVGARRLRRTTPSRALRGVAGTAIVTAVLAAGATPASSQLSCSKEALRPTSQFSRRRSTRPPRR